MKRMRCLWCGIFLTLAALPLASCGTTQVVNPPQSASLATPTATVAVPTNTPIPPRPTPTRVPPTPTPAPPNIAGSYSGSFTFYGQSGNNPMQMHISQSGRTLSGTTTEGSTVYNDSGTISLNGHFTITEVSSSGTAYLVGSLVGSGHLSGTWNTGGNALGTWDVFRT